MKNILKPGLLALAVAHATVAFAKLPEPSPEAKAKAAEAAEKTAWSGKVDAYKLCLAQDRAAAHYKKTKLEVSTKSRPTAAAPSACANPGPFMPAAAAPVTKSS